MGKVKKIALNCGLIFISLCLALGLLELFLPLFHIFNIEEAVYQVRRPVVQYMYGRFHPELQYTLQPDLQNIRLFYPRALDYTILTNSQGFRGPEWDRSPQRRNIVLLGDSFAFGWGVEWDQTAGRILEKKLQAVDPAFQVIQLTMPGYSIKEIIRCFELYGKQFNPEAVIYLFCPNDTESMSPPVAPGVYDLNYHPKPGDKGEFARALERNQRDFWTWDKFRRGSYLHAFYARYVRPIISTRIRRSLRVDSSPPGFDFPPPLVSEVAPPLTREAEFLEYCLVRLASQVEGPLFLLSTSDKTILVKEDSPGSRRWLLRRFCRNHGQVFVDFESMVRQTPDGRRFYLRYDDHWSPAGHAVAAGMLFETFGDLVAESRMAGEKQ